MGLAFLHQTEYLLPITVVTLLVAVAALGFRATRRGGYSPFAVGLVAAVLVVAGKFAWDSAFMTYSGITLLIVASVWNSWPKTMARSALVELGKKETDSPLNR